MAAILILNKLEFGALMSKNLKIIKSTKLHMDAFKITDSLPLKYFPSPPILTHVPERNWMHAAPQETSLGSKLRTGDWHRLFSPHSHGTKDTELWRPL